MKASELSKFLDYGHTCSGVFLATGFEQVGDYFMPWWMRQKQAEPEWTCQYCLCINLISEHNCFHCGAPRRLRIDNEVRQPPVRPEDRDSNWETCAVCAGAGTVRGFMGRRKVCRECNGEGQTLIGTYKVYW